MARQDNMGIQPLQRPTRLRINPFQSAREKRIVTVTATATARVTVFVFVFFVVFLSVGVTVPNLVTTPLSLGERKREVTIPYRPDRHHHRPV